MNSKALLHSLLISALTFTPLFAQAAHKRHHHQQQSYTSFARVTHVEPIVRYVEVNRPYKECWDEYDEHNNHRPHTNGQRAPIFNGTIGNRLLNTQTDKKSEIRQPKTSQQSHSRGKKEHHREHRQECRVVNRHHREKQIDGYQVHYRYKGENFETRLPYHPGDRLKVRVSVTPIRH